MHGQRGWGFASAILASAVGALLCAAAAFAGAVVADVEGDVRVAAADGKARAIVPGQRVEPGSLVTTAGAARVTLHFDDGMWAALHENSRLRIEGFSYRQQEPAADRAALELLRGALRIVTGALGRRNPEAFKLRTPKMLVGVRGTDFMVAIMNPTYVSVLQGIVTATNAGGTETFRAGDLGAAAADATLAATIPASALPAAVTTAFGSLGALRMAPPASSGAAGRVTPPQVGQDAAARARELKQDLGRNRANGAADAAREQARDIPSKPRPK